MANYEFLNEVLLTDDTELVAIPSHLNSIKPAVLKNSLYDTDRPLNVKMNKTLSGTEYYLNNIQGRLNLDNKFIKNDMIFRTVEVFGIGNGTENGEIVYETSSKTYKYYVAGNLLSLGNSIKIVTYDDYTSISVQRTSYLIECATSHIIYDVIKQTNGNNTTLSYRVSSLSNIKMYTQIKEYGMLPFNKDGYPSIDINMCEIISNPLENKTNIKIMLPNVSSSINTIQAIIQFFDETNRLNIIFYNYVIPNSGEFIGIRLPIIQKQLGFIPSIDDYIKKNILYNENDLIKVNNSIFSIPFTEEQLLNERIMLKKYENYMSFYKIVLSDVSEKSKLGETYDIDITNMHERYRLEHITGYFQWVKSTPNLNFVNNIECFINGKPISVTVNSQTLSIKLNEFNVPEDDSTFDDVNDNVSISDFFDGAVLIIYNGSPSYHYTDKLTKDFYRKIINPSVDDLLKDADEVKTSDFFKKLYGSTTEVKTNIMNALYQNTIPAKKQVLMNYHNPITNLWMLPTNRVFTNYEISYDNTGINLIICDDNKLITYNLYNPDLKTFPISNTEIQPVVYDNMNNSKIISNYLYPRTIIKQSNSFYMSTLTQTITPSTGYSKVYPLSIISDKNVQNLPIFNLPSNTNHIEMKLIDSILYVTVFANNVEFGKLELTNATTWNYIKIGNINDNDNIAFKRDTKEYKIYKISTGSGYRYFKREKYYFKEITLSEKQSEINIENTDLYNISKDKIVSTKRKIKGKISKIRQKDNSRDFVLVPAIAVVIVKSSSYKENVIKSMPCLLKMRYSVNENQDYSYWDSLSKGGFKSIKEIYMEDAVEGGSIGEGSLNYFLFSVYNINYNVKKLRPYNVNKRLHYKSQMEFFNTLSEIDDFINNIENLNLYVYSVKNKVKYKTIYQNVIKLVKDKNNIVNYTWGETVLNNSILLQGNRLSCIDVTINYDLPVNIEVSQEYNLNIIDSKIYDSVNNDFKFNITDNFIYMCNRNCLTNDWNTIAYRMFDDDYTLNSTEKYIDNFIEYKNALIDITVNKRAVQPNINKCVTLENMDSVQLQIPRNGVIYIGLQNEDVTITDTPTETVINIYDNTTKYNY